MKIDLVNVYACEYCNKKQFRKCDMSRHEKYCSKNPANKHMCFEFCKHLIKSEEEYEGQSNIYAGETYFGQRTVFTCAVLGKKMYSYLAEKRNLPIVKESDVERMPTECDKYSGTRYITDFAEDDIYSVI